MSVLAVVFFVAVGAQIIFYIFFLIAFSRSSKASNYSHSVSVVVCAHDEENNLRELIPLLLSQEHPDYEVIIANDRSNDNTLDLLKEEAKKDNRLRVVHVDHLPPHANAKKYALSLAIKAAQKEIILLTDADCRPKGNRWIKKMTDVMDGRTNIVLGYSPYFSEASFLNLFIRFETLITAIQYLSLALLKMPYMGVGRNMAYKRSLFMDNKGFQDLMGITGGDDDLFINRHATSANTLVCLSQDTLVYSYPKRTWGSYLEQKLRHLSVGKYYRGKHKWVLGIYISTFIITWFLGLALIFAHTMAIAIIIALVVRCLMVLITIQLASNKLGDKFSLWPVIFLDFLYAIYYLSNGLRALVTRKIKWTN
ncbi:MAG TPA: glycosyltransferase [Cyclobacteriaceae bacterium]|nr:glycosyltransferase [Cyclobacteriaceae bacterium]